MAVLTYNEFMQTGTTAGTLHVRPDMVAVYTDTQANLHFFTIHLWQVVEDHLGGGVMHSHLEAFTFLPGSSYPTQANDLGLTGLYFIGYAAKTDLQEEDYEYDLIEAALGKLHSYGIMPIAQGDPHPL